jgi:hypothetical protein
MKHFTKKLALLSLLAGMCGSAWADVINATLDHTASSSRNGSNAITTTVDQEKEHYNNSKAAAWGGWAYAQFSFTIPSGHSIASAKLTWGTKIGGNTNTRDNYIYYVNSGKEIDYESLTSTTNLNLTGDATFITNVRLYSANDNSSVETDVTSAVQTIAATQSYIIFEWTNNAAGADLYGKVSEHKPTLVITTVAETLYTATFSETTGLTPTIAIFKDEDRTEPITNGALRNNTTYYYTATLSGYYDYNGSFKVNGDNPSVSFTMDAKSLITYNVVAVDGEGNILSTLSTGTVYEGETANYGYSQFIAVDGVLYTAAKQITNPWWGKSFTPQADGETVTITYTPEGTTGVVFCEEAENISTLTPVTGGNTDIRASNRAGGYAASDALITTLPAGKYKVAGATYGNAGTTFTVKAGEEIVLTITTAGNPVHTVGEEFVLTEETEIIVPQAGNGGNSPKTIDYLYIVKTGDVVLGTLAAGKFATRIFPFAPAAIEGVKYYSCAGTQDGTNTLALTEVSAPVANVPYILENTTKAEIDITQTGVDIHEAETYTEGYLTGVFSNDVVAPVGSYVLQTQSGKQAFYVVEEGVEIKNMQYRAYLTTANNVKALYLSGDDVTAINTLDALTSGAYEGIYTADGVKLNRIEKGVNILKMADGTTRKVIVK